MRPLQYGVASETEGNGRGTRFKLNGEPYSAKVLTSRHRSRNERIIAEALAIANRGKLLAAKADRDVEHQKKKRDYDCQVNESGARIACRHCKKGLVNRPRGLCWGCYYTPGVKELYPSTSKYARRGNGGGMAGLPLAPETTAALPGTAEKVAVMAARSAAGFAIFHPKDGPVEADHLQRRAA